MSESFLDGRVVLHIGDVREQLRQLPDDHFDCVVTSPPYWGLRDYGTATWEGGLPDCDHRSPTMRDGRNEDRATLAGSAATNRGQLLLAHRSRCGKCGAVKVDHQIGLESTLGEHLDVMVEVLREVRRVLKPTGTMWLNYGDCYATSPNGRSAAEVKEIGNDDRTFRDKPFSTVGPIRWPKQERSNGGEGQHFDRRGGFLKAKDLCMIPNRLAIALQDDGWWVRSEIIWHKPNPMPESTRDRPTSAHEKIWLMAKNERYFYDADAIAEPANPEHFSRYRYEFTGGKKGLDEAMPLGRSIHPKGIREFSGTRNARNVWTMGTAAFSEAHFATFPAELAERCIKAGCPAGGSVLDPFGGAGTTALAALANGRTATLIELNPEYATLARARIEAAFMGKEEGARHMVKQLGKLEQDAGPLFQSL